MPVNWDFIESEEGESTRIGYVPYDPDKDNSGVTVGIGIDLGARSETELRSSLRLSDSLVNKLKPYLHLKGKNARFKLKTHPLVLTTQEEYELNSAVALYYERKLEKRWNRDTTSVQWHTLGNTKQTVVMSVYYQYGNKMFSFDFWKQVTGGDWAGALKNLRDFGDAFDKRRNREANALELVLTY